MLRFTKKRQQGHIIHFFYVLLLIRYTRTMTYTAETPRSREYQSPALRIIPVNVENVICDSTIPGGNEDIGYEDWD